MKYLAALILMMTINMNGFAQPPYSMDAKQVEKMQTQLDKDWNNHDLKYYSFGIAPRPVNEMVRSIMKEKYGITFVSAGCIVDNDRLIYNELLKDRFTKEYGKTLHEMMKHYEDLHGKEK